jgi:hypothetical protein
VRARALLALAAVAALALALAAPAGAAPSAAWKLVVTPMPSNFAPGAEVEYLLIATNVGGGPTTGSYEVSADLPSGVVPSEVTGVNEDPLSTADLSCAIAAQHVSCAGAGGPEEALGSSRTLVIKVQAHVDPGVSGQGEVQATVAGGGGGQASATAITPFSAQVAPFGFFEALTAPANDAEGNPAKLAGSHPYQMTLGFGFPTERIGKELISTEHPRDVRIELPRGMIGNPAATELLCTEAELTSEACPEESQVGIASVTTLIAGAGTDGPSFDALYNMVPPPGSPAAFGFDAAGVGFFIHSIAHVRNGTDYSVYATTNDLLALGGHPVFNAQVQLWGDPSGDAHETVRGACRSDGKNPKKGNQPCSIDNQETPFLTLPGDCPGNPLSFKAFADSWESPGAFKETSYESADLQGAPVFTEDCGALAFAPTIKAQPTNLSTDSPTGLNVDLHQPQQGPEADPLAAPATAILKDTTVTFPAGLAVNPSQATGLEACTESQIGFEGKGEEAGELDFTEAPQSCPEAAKIANLTASSPLLVQYDEATHKPLRDPQTGRRIPRVLSGSVYLAEPFANPFGSLIATYFSIEDPKTGIVAKLAGEGQLDPATGQITFRVLHSPELPVEDFHVSVFGGDRGAFVSPPTCTPQQAGAELVPWSAPEGLPAHPTDSFTPTAAPGGGPCPAEEAQMPNSPALSAGTLSPVAGTYSPLLFRLSRQDGSQRFARVQATLPAGLIAKLAGVGQCSEAEIAKARSREAPNQGAAEIADPSCPASSQVGTVTVGAGAGPHPYQATGKVYLAGPYKGAPLSFAIIAPAVSGPFDLGTVVTRAAVYLDPETARARAVSDPIPQIIDGVPLDVRTVQMRVDRPGFSLNPTSCDEESFEGQLTSALGSIAPLTERFQASGCRSLPYKPKLSARLFGPTNRGAHPSLRSVFTAKPGEANSARISVALPHSEFIDQAHFRTICTRVQFAAGACPPGAVYGHARVFTPLLDSPLEGPVYLRSSTHELPDLVLALHGPPSLPIELDAVGRVDSVNGGVRVTFEAVPDAPLTKAIVTTQGAKKGLFQNSTELCRSTHRITLKLEGQNGKAHDVRPELRAGCPGHKKKKKGSRRR